MLRIYSVFDIAANQYTGAALMLFPADAAAIRMFEDACFNRQSFIGAHPSDHELVYLGEFDPETGHIGAEPPKVIREGNKVIRKTDVPVGDPSQLEALPHRYPQTIVGQMETAMTGGVPNG